MVEAVPEAERLKRQVFQALDGLAPAHAILASNTSSIAITRLAAATRRPDRVVGLHFMNPVRGNVMGLAGGRAGGRALHCIDCSTLVAKAARGGSRRQVMVCAALPPQLLHPPRNACFLPPCVCFPLWLT